MEKMVYAMFDWTAKRGNSGCGFANTKRAIAFSSKKKLDDFLADRGQYDFSARRISRREAMMMLETVPCTRDKGLQLDGIDGDRYITLRESKY